jgi:hypothetical protein
MALKIAGHLFTGPMNLDTTVVRANHVPVVYSVLSKEGPAWDPIFRVIEVGASGAQGTDFTRHASRAAWQSKAKGQLCLYTLPLEDARWRDVAAREALAAEIAARYLPPNDLVTVTG